MTLKLVLDNGELRNIPIGGFCNPDAATRALEERVYPVIRARDQKLVGETRYKNDYFGPVHFNCPSDNPMDLLSYLAGTQEVSVADSIGRHLDYVEHVYQLFACRAAACPGCGQVHKHASFYVLGVDPFRLAHETNQHVASLRDSGYESVLEGLLTDRRSLKDYGYDPECTEQLISHIHRMRELRAKPPVFYGG